MRETRKALNLRSLQQGLFQFSRDFCVWKAPCNVNRRALPNAIRFEPQQKRCAWKILGIVAASVDLIFFKKDGFHIATRIKAAANQQLQGSKKYFQKNDENPSGGITAGAGRD